MAGSDPGTGRFVGGKYELGEVAGEGGMAIVYRAMMHGAAGFTRPVAVKKIKAEYRAVKNYIAMFVEEARVGSELAHPNIVQVFDFCTDEEGAYYLVMEWVEGIDLGSFVRSFRERELATHWPLVTAIGIGALRGLAAAHERRRADGSAAPVVHRDVSPHNVLLGVNGTVKITDFGLARARDRAFSLTAPGTVKGKLSYLSPEITAGKPATTSTDVFAMGCVLWESLAGQRLFEADSDMEVFQMIRQGKIKPLGAARPDLPPRLVDAVHRALAIRPEERFPTARAMAVELAECLRSDEVSLDAQTLLGTSVARARDALGMREASEDQATWSFSIDWEEG